MYGEVFAYLIEHCTKELSLERVAYYFGYEKHYFSRLLKRVSVIGFKQLHGCTPFEYRKQIAVKK